MDRAQVRAWIEVLLMGLMLGATAYAFGMSLAGGTLL